MTKRTIAAACGLVSTAALVGCSGSGPAGRDAAVRANVTPELQTLYQRPIEVDNRMVLTSDENLRMAWEDMGRMWLFDRPSRLARERIPR
ncbi:MAG TPA: hypothetical protein VFN82_03215 [Solirubrobacterales bacterium]|nr:hypothetical protein [Solirubrobacterales bacterium]